ncbi:hypothetical protein HZP54_10070 [Elizabethkingia anophelis]|nr:hypothetical protein [Elizabethkingia anophelis]MCT4233321.1 hypothetical protein [Elizabethkingia anophelis]
MKNDIYSYLKFRLGEEYCNFEFEVIPLPPYEILENSLILEPYEYFGEISEIFGFTVRHIILYFNADILMRVELRIKGNVIDQLSKQIKIIKNMLFPNEISMIIRYLSDVELTIIEYFMK